MDKLSPQNQKTIEFDGIWLDSKYRDLIAELRKRGITTMEQIRRTALCSYVQSLINEKPDYLRELQICVTGISEQKTLDYEWDDAIGKSVSIEILASEKNIYNFCKGNGIKTLYGLFRPFDKSLTIKNEDTVAFVATVNKMPASVLTISDKTVNILRKNGIWTVGQIIITGTGFLSHLPGISDQELCSIQIDLNKLPEKVAYYRQVIETKPIITTIQDEQELPKKSVIFTSESEDGKDNFSESVDFDDEDKFVTKQAFQEFLKTKDYKAKDIALFCHNLQNMENTCNVNIFGVDIETCRQGIAVIKEKLTSPSLYTKTRKEAFDQFEQFLKECYPESEPEIHPKSVPIDNMLTAYADELDYLIYNNFEKYPGRISALTTNGIERAWKKAQTQKFVIQSQSDNPLLFSRIARSFQKCTFIGDIEISDDDYKLLIYYFRHLSNVETKNSTYKMGQDPFFAVILVQIGMRYYNGNYWPDVSKELGKKLDGVKQKAMRKNFMSVLDRYGKIHLENDDFMNIMLHGFVSDHYAADFFDMLNKYYRIDLHRNLENNTEKLLDRMLTRIAENRNNQFVAQTKYAVQNNPERSSEIINDLLHYLDIAFHDNEFQTPVTRMHRLLNQWMQSDEGFQTALQREERSRTSYQKRFSRPYFYYDNAKEMVSLVMPSQMVDDEGQETLEWRIKTNHDEIHIPVPILEEGITGAKTDQTKIELPVTQWFDEMLMNVIDPVSGNEFTEVFRIPKEHVRFFDSSGMSRDPNHMPIGDITAIVEKGYQLLSNGLTETVNLSTHDIVYLKLEKGDIVHISSGDYYIAGHDFVEGIARNASIRDITTEKDGEQLQIYSDLPILRFKVKPEMVEGMVINANGIRYNVRNNLPEAIDLGSGTEECGYEIHLNDYLQARAGRYHIVLDFPDARHNRFFDFIYLPQFSFQFNYQPYIFQEEGSITFFCPELEITPQQSDVQLNDEGEAFIFPIDKDHLSLLFLARANDNEIPFSIKVPCLRYSLVDGVWNTDLSEIIMKEDLPDEILFDFSDVELTVSLTSKGRETETLTKDSEGIFHYQTNTIRNYSIGDRYKVDVYLSSPEIQKQFEGKKLFLTVLLRSFVREKRIVADFDAGIINGFLDVVGGKDYSVDIFCNNRKIAESIPVINKRFSLEKNIDNGIYQIDVFEDETNEFGLDSGRKQIDSFKTELIDIHNLSGKSVKINSLLIKTPKIMKTYKVQRELIVRNLEKTEKYDRHCYYGFLDKMNVRVRVFIPDINDLTHAGITFWDEENHEYFDFIYGTITSSLLLEQKDSFRKRLYDRYLLLNCDDSDWDAPCVGVDMKTIFEVSVE